MNQISLYIFFCIVYLSIESSWAITASWVDPVDGLWENEEKWSTDPVFPDNGVPNGTTTYDVILDATGTPYTVTNEGSITIDTLSITSADATLRQNGFDLTVLEGIHLDGGVIDLRGRTRFDGNNRISGSGVIEFNSPYYNSLEFSGDNSMPVIEQGITIRSAGASGEIRRNSGHTTGILRLQNYGTISAETAGETLWIDPGANTANFGVLSASNGGTLDVNVLNNSDLNDVVIAEDSSVLIKSWHSKVNKPIHVPPSATLELGWRWSNSEPITIDRGTFVANIPDEVGLVTFSEGNLVFANSSTWTVQALNQITTSPDTVIAFGPYASLTLAGQNWDYNQVVGDLDLNGATIENGTLIGAPGVNELPLNGGRLTLDEVTLDLEIVQSQGGFLLKGNSVIAQPVTLNESYIRQYDSPDTVTINQPLTVTNGGLHIYGDWINNSEVRVQNSTVSLYSLPEDFGDFQMTGGVLRFGGYTRSVTMAEYLQIPSELGTPDEVHLAGLTDLDLEGTTVDLATIAPQIILDGGELSNGVILDSSGTTPLRVIGRGSELEDVDLHADVQFEGDSYLSLDGTGSVEEVTFTGDQGFLLISYASQITGKSLTMDSNVRVRGRLLVSEGIEINRDMVVGQYGSGEFIGDQSIAGEGEITLDGDTASGNIVSRDGLLTIGHDITIRHRGSGGIPGYFDAQGGLINLGTLIADKSFRGIGQTFRITAPTLSNTGTIMIQGGIFRLEVDNWTNEGTVRLQGGAVEFAGSSFSNSVIGIIEGIGELNASSVSFNNHGTLAPGHSTGILRINGDYLQSETGSLDIELDGTSSSGVEESEFDQLLVAGSAILQGDIAVTVLPGFFPMSEDVFPILTAQNIVGTFSNASSSLDLGYGIFDVLYTDTEILLTNFQPTAPLEGDFDLDGLVDGSDFLFWQRNGLSSTDLENWKENFGSSWQPSIPTAISVPEPSSIGLLLVLVTLASLTKVQAIGNSGTVTAIRD